MAQILVVDDDPEVARLLVTLLTFHGFAAASADSGERALEVLQQQAFQAVLLDVRLPGMNGFETCRRIREVHGPTLPVMILTAFGDAAALREALRAGADDFLHKPVDSAALVLKARALLRFKALHDEVERSRAQAEGHARDLELLHEIGRDWSLIAEPEEFHRMVTQRLARLIGAEICVVALYDRESQSIAAALPAHGLPDEVARDLRYAVRAELTSVWNLRSGRPYVSNQARSDPRLDATLVARASAESVVLVPMISEGALLGLLVAANKPGGFRDADVQLLSLFAGPAATFLRSRQIFEQQRRHAARLERLAALVGEMSSTSARGALVSLVVQKVCRDLGYARAAFYALGEDGTPQLEAEAGEERPSDLPADVESLRWTARAVAPLQAEATGDVAELAVPVRAAGRVLGLLLVLRRPGRAFPEEEVNLLAALAGQLAVALDKAASVAETEKLARQMATLYDVGLETAALQDLQRLFSKAAAEAGRLIGADHTSVFRLDPVAGELRLFAAWARDPQRERRPTPVFRLGEGIAGQVAADWQPVLLNEVEDTPAWIDHGRPVARLLCVPLGYFDQERGQQVIFGVLNATRGPGGSRFQADDLGYLTRFASQLSIAVTNSMAFASERERSEQLAFVNATVRESAGSLSRERIFEAAVRRLREVFRYPAVLIGVNDHEAGLIRIAAGASEAPRREGWGSVPAEAGVLGQALRERRTVLVADAAAQPDARRHAPSTRSQAAVPIVSGDEAVAVLLVESSRPAIRGGELITLETLADSLGIILRNADLYQALEQTNAKLVELDRLKSELIHIVAHDFRSPLAGVLGYAELLEWKPGAPREERVQRARAIRVAAEHMAQMVEKTLTTTRLESGQLAYDFGVTDLAAVVREVAERFTAEPPHPLELDLPDDPLPCWADQDRITEVVENLLSNAAKYSPEGRLIAVAIERQHETATVRVRDRGVGIAAADLPRLFRPFSRVQRAGIARVPGSGLGLYICERIVRAHGGQLGVESVPDEGSTFWFRLPLFGVAAQTRPASVLVAAADEGTRRELRRVAESLGFVVHEARDGVEAVEAASRLVPTAAVLDRVLPHLRAEEVAERLREKPATARVPLVVLAAAEDLSAPQQALFQACVPKPLDRATLGEALESVTGRGAPRRPAGARR